MDKINILFLAADPSDSSRLRLGQELRDIREKLQLSKQRDKFSLEARESVRTGDITQAIFDVQPNIVHFSGHGMSSGELCFEDILGKTQPVKPDALANLFKLVANEVNCVVLNACYSEIQARSIAKHIPFVIGMNQSIGDKAAIAFAIGFYKALGAGRSVRDAYEFACVEIQLADIPEHSTPILLDKEKLNKLGDHQTTLSTDSASFFYQRFMKSFPGIRGIQSFNSPHEAIIRLSKLLEAPLTFTQDGFRRNPIWWFRGSANLQIESFQFLKDDIILINEDELKINRVIAVNYRAYYQCFVYVESLPMNPSNLYHWKSDKIQAQIEEYGYFYEEFGVYKGEFLVTRAEYDDGAATINGKLVELDRHSTELRVRYLSPYNLIIAAFDSPINNKSFDQSFEKIMNQILRGQANIEDLNRTVLELPKRSHL